MEGLLVRFLVRNTFYHVAIVTLMLRSKNVLQVFCLETRKLLTLHITFVPTHKFIMLPSDYMFVCILGDALSDIYIAINFIFWNLQYKCYSNYFYLLENCLNAINYFERTVFCCWYCLGIEVVLLLWFFEYFLVNIFY